MSKTQVIKSALTAMFIAFFAGIGFAQEGASTKEAGAYKRSSVVYLDVVAYKSRALSNGSWQNYLVKTIQDTVRMDRFDYSFISQTIVDRFVEMPANTSIEDRMNATIVPAILAAVDAEKEIRAQAMLSEQQRNSFITDKAKELGITEEELSAVMNSAYIFVPVYDSHEQGKNDKGEFVIKLNAGGYWWRIDNTGDTPNAIMIAKIERTRTGTDADVNKAFQIAVRNIAEDVKVATRAIPAFTLSGQILSKGARNVEMSVGKNEGVVIDDRYRVFAESDGVEQKRGWVMVNKILTETEESKSSAQIISGIPFEGATIREIPALPYDVAIMGVMVPYSFKSGKDRGLLGFRDVKIKGDYLYGPRLKVSGNMANLLQKTGFPVPQLWLNIRGEYLFGGVEGRILAYDDAPDSGWEIENVQSYGGDISFTKKFYARRFAIAPEIGVGYKRMVLKLGDALAYDYDSKEYYTAEYGVAQWNIGFFGELGLEVAITPLANIGVNAGYNIYTGGNDWKFTYTAKNGEWKEDETNPTWDSGDYKLNGLGLTFGVYFNMALPSGSKRQKANDNVGE